MKHLSFEQAHMNTRVTIDLYEPIAAEARKDCLSRAFGVFADLEKQFSLFDKRSELSRVNRFSGREIKVSDNFLQAAAYAWEIARRTNGAFNSLHRSNTHYSRLMINERRGIIMIPKDAILDLNSVIKGQAIDQALSCFPKSSSVMIEAGGDIGVRNLPGNAAQVWKIGVRDPCDPKKILTVLPILSGAVCTSGEYFRGNHIAKSNNETASVTATASSARVADVLSTAAYSMPINQAILFIEQFPECSALIIDKRGEIYMGRRLLEQFKKYYEA